MSMLPTRGLLGAALPLEPAEPLPTTELSVQQSQGQSQACICGPVKNITRGLSRSRTSHEMEEKVYLTPTTNAPPITSSMPSQWQGHNFLFSIMIERMPVKTTTLPRSIWNTLAYVIVSPRYIMAVPDVRWRRLLSVGECAIVKGRCRKNEEKRANFEKGTER